MSGKKLKILCLHGYRQTGPVFRQRTGALRKALKKQAEFVFVTAPHEIKSEDEEKMFGWWFSADDNSYDAHDVTDCSIGLKESLSVVATALKEHGPVDGILAFSQGASLLSIICSLKQSKDEQFQDFNFAIFISGYKSRQTEHQDCYKMNVTFPTLHVMGDGDKVIEKEMSEDLLSVYDDKSVINHKGGHFVPATSAEKSQYIQFLSNFLE